MRRPLVLTALIGLSATFLPALPAQALAVPSAIRVNFQPAAAAAAPYFAEPQPGTSTSYLVDSGQPFGPRNGLNHGWVAPGTGTARDLTANTRDRNAAGVPQRLDTFIHMQPAGGLAGSWELQVPNGDYTVVAGVGDATATDSRHRLQVEGQVVVDGFAPTAGERFRGATRHVSVADGRLTVAAAGGTNTKLDYLEVYPGHRPYLTGVAPGDGQVSVSRDGAVSASVQVVPPPGNGVEEDTLTAGNVRLVRERDGQAVAGSAGTTGGNDAINFQPGARLEANTAYRFEVDFQTTDEAGNAFVPFWSTFTTGTATATTTTTSFTRVAQPAVPEKFYTSVVTGPDGKLYAGTVEGDVYRFTVGTGGALQSPQLIGSLRAKEGGPRLLIGMAFDPSATAGNLKLWVSHSTYGFGGMADWGGKISTLAGPDLATVTDEVVKLPRSAKDHLANSVAFGPDGALYLPQGANSAAGDLDPAWANRPERLLTAAILRVDVAALATRPPLDVQTEGVAAPYDPRPADAPVRVHASGVRNAYDLVWADNGQLYSAINGTGGGAIAPAVPAPRPASCTPRLADAKPYTATTTTGQVANLPVQPDLAARIVPGGYYGNPNPSRCEWILNGGNPTAAVDPLEVVAGGSFNGYATGVAPDPNWRRDQIHVLGKNLSPNGMIQYRGPGSELDGTLMVTAFSNCDCILALTRSAAGEITGQTRIGTGTYGFENPLDLAQGPAGSLYVANRTDKGPATGSIELLVPTVQ